MMLTSANPVTQDWAAYVIEIDSFRAVQPPGAKLANG